MAPTGRVYYRRCLADIPTLTAPLREGTGATHDPLIQCRLRPGGQGTGGEQVEPTSSTSRTKSMPDSAATNKVQRVDTGTPITTP